jgi:tetratricopeptide (TPR) repeat protein
VPRPPKLSWILPCLAPFLASGPVSAQPAASPARPAVPPAARFEQAVAEAEKSLRAGDGAGAEARYQAALGEGWLLLGTLDRLDERLPEARDAFLEAASTGHRPALLSLAVAHLQVGETAQAAEVAQRLVEAAPTDPLARRLRGQALLAGGQVAPAVEQLVEAQRLDPADLETAFVLAGAYLAQKTPERAEPIFARIVKARPIARTHLLVARTYREHGELERARAAARAALAADPRLKGAHLLLGLLAAQEGQRSHLDTAIAEFKAELAIVPDDARARLEWGVALVESQRAAEALPALEAAARVEPAQSRTLYYLGRAQAAAGRGADAVTSFRRALELATRQGANAPALRAIHLQLAQALRAAGAADEAAVHFAESARQSAEGASAEEASLARYLSDAPDPGAPRVGATPVIETTPLAGWSGARRAELRRAVAGSLAQAYLNLGVLRMQAQDFPAAVARFEKAVALDPSSAQAEASLGIARFNARQFEQATGPLERAVAARPDDRGLTRMLALAWVNLEQYAKAVPLLEGDPERTTNPSLQFAYGLALVKSDRGAEAEQAFQELVSRHGDSAELSVLMGQAHAQQGDFDAAVESLQRALRLKADVPEASATLGVIYLRQGKLPEAEAALRAELAVRPADTVTRQHLAIVLESLQRPQEAIAILRDVLAAKADLPDSRYLLGKLLLAQGGAAEALTHLEAAVALAPEDANIRYQLGRAYQQLGRPEQAEQQFEAFRRIKDKPQGE